MEKHYVFKSIFEDNLTQVSCDQQNAEDYAEMRVPLGAHFRCWYSSRATRRLLVDNGCSSPELCNRIQYCLACRNLSIPPDVKMSPKNTLRYRSEIIGFKKVSTANARCCSDQRCMNTEGFKPLYPAMCVSPRHVQRCRHGAIFKSSNSFCPALIAKLMTTIGSVMSD